MKRLVALSVMALIMAGSPAIAQAERKTELIDLDGRSVDEIQLRYGFEPPWVVDNQTVLWRDTHRDYYVVRLKAPCAALDIRKVRLSFFPAWTWRLESGRAYEVRPRIGQRCEVARIEKVDDARAIALRDASQHRAW